MHRSSRRRSAVAFASLLALAAAALIQPVTAGAATATSTVTITDPTNDTFKGSTPPGTPSAEPKADITAASVRYQNGFITFTMKLVKGDDLARAEDEMFWSVGSSEGQIAKFQVDMKKGTNGFGQALVSVPNSTGAPYTDVSCLGTAASFDVAAGTYMAIIPASCVGSPADFKWDAERDVLAPGESTNPTRDIAPNDGPPDNGVAAAVTNMKTTGYWAIGSDGKVYPFGDATKAGEPASASLSIVDIDAAPHGTGYWALDNKGVVTAFGPVHYGNVTDLKSGERAVSLSSTPTGAGYWVFTNKGRAIAFGDAKKDIGDVSKLPLNGEILDSAAMPSGNGYFLVAADGGVFALGDAKYQGSMADTKLNKPVLSIVPDPDGEGYWLVASDGGVFAFKAPFRGSTGSMTLQKPMTGMVPFGNGYLMVAEDGGVFVYSDRQFSGSLGNNPPANPIVSITALS
jgi:hypothetical protein